MYSLRQLEAVCVNTGRCDLTVSPKGPCFGRAPFKTEHNEMSVLDAAAKPWSKYSMDLFSLCQENCFFTTCPALCAEAADGPSGCCERLPFCPSNPELPRAGSKAVASWSTRNVRMENLPHKECPETEARRSLESNQITQLKASSGGPWLRKGVQGIQGGDGWGLESRTIFLAQTTRNESGTCFLLWPCVFALQTLFSLMVASRRPQKEKGLFVFYRGQ